MSQQFTLDYDDVELIIELLTDHLEGLRDGEITGMYESREERIARTRALIATMNEVRL